MDIQNLAFSGLVAYGLVNVLTWKFPTLDKGIKLTILIVVAFAISFVPVDLGNMLADKIKEAVSIALLMTGVGKIASKVGRN